MKRFGPLGRAWTSRRGTIRKRLTLDEQLKRLGCVRSTGTLPPVERSGLIWVERKGYVQRRVMETYTEVDIP